jgi:hypothetical protein
MAVVVGLRPDEPGTQRRVSRLVLVAAAESSGCPTVKVMAVPHAIVLLEVVIAD